MHLYPCDLCNSDDLAEIDCAPYYMGGRPLHVCRTCGMVQAAYRKTAQEVKAAWAEDMYRTDNSNKLSDSSYTAAMPAVQARQTFAASFINNTIALKGKSVCDLGAGEGDFLLMLEAAPYHASTFAVEPSVPNAEILSARGLKHFIGVAEELLDAEPKRRESFDVVTLIWTLENCHSALAVMRTANALLKPDGHLAIATGSRLLVPFKKPLHYFLGPNVDVHPNHFSANTLRGYMAETGFEMIAVNRFIDSDYLVMVGQKTASGPCHEWPKDDPDQVLDFFRRWHDDTRAHYSDYVPG